jgi:hypothetical protein
MFAAVIARGVVNTQRCGALLWGFRRLLVVAKTKCPFAFWARQNRGRCILLKAPSLASG